MEETKLIARKRNEKKSAAMRRMRKRGILPAVIYSDGAEAMPIQLDRHVFEVMLHRHTSEKMMINVEVEGVGTFPVLIKDVQHEPVSGELLHVDLYKVSMNKKVAVDIPVELVGDAKGVQAGGLLEHLLHEIPVECLPSDLLEVIEVDVSNLDIGEMITVNDINLDPQKYEILLDRDTAVVMVAAPRVTAEEEAGEEEGAESGAAEPEVISEKKVEKTAE